MREFEKYLKQSEFTDYEDFRKNFEIKVPENFNFSYDVLDALAEKSPDKPALLWVSEDMQRERTVTFAEMSALSKRAANMFSSLGIKKGDRVMLILKRHIEFWICTMAFCRIGAAVIPATHQLQEKDIVYRVNMAGVKMIVTTAESNIPAETDKVKGDCPSLDKLMVVHGEHEGWLNFDEEMAKYADEFPRPEGDAATHNEDIMMLYFTSGTTGMPKMAAHDFAYPLGHIVTAVYWLNVQHEGLHLTVSDTGWMKAVWGKLYGQWLAETCVFVYEFDHFNPANMLHVMEKYGITSFCAPPTIYRYFIKEDLSKYDLSKIKWASTAGEPMNPEVFKKFYEATGLRLHEIFGQTELTVTVGTFLWMEPKPGSMGKPSPSFDVKVMDVETGELCGPGETGEMVIDTSKGRPVGMFMGYYDDEELTQSVWHDEYYHTGDVCWIDEDGYFWYVGRCDDVIKSSGYRIGPFEVESVLLKHPAVLECAITGVPHPERGQIVKATIVLSKGYTASDELKKELQNFVKSNTAPYKYPREVEFVPELPKTISQKIQRYAIRNKDKEKQN